MKRKKEGEIMAEKGVHRDRNRNVNKLTNRQRSNKGYNEKKRLKQTQTKASKTPPPLPGPTGRGGEARACDVCPNHCRPAFVIYWLQQMEEVQKKI